MNACLPTITGLNLPNTEKKGSVKASEFTPNK